MKTTNFKNINYLKQIKFSFFYKIFALLSAFLVVRYSLQYLGIELYGLWTVILTFINWIIFFDLGIANGIKNQLSKCLANEQIEEAKEYISTGYGIALIFSFSIYIILLIFSFFINWQAVFNIDFLSNSYLQVVILLTSFFILLNFVISIITTIFNVTQNASYIVFSQFITQLLSLMLVVILNLFAEKSLLFIATSYGCSLLFTNFSMSIWFYKKNINLIPKFNYFKTNKIKSILSLGAKFFILQLTVLIIMSSDRMISIHLLNINEVTNYDLLYRYFSIVMIFHTLINNPLWPMYTEAFQKKDYIWIKNILKKLNLLLLGYSFIILIMIYLGDKFILFWTGNENIIISKSNYIYMGLLIITLIWSSIYAYFLNGIEKLNVQLITTVLGAIINIPLSIFLSKYLEMGLNGILLATILSLLIFNIAGTIQTYVIIYKWDRDEKNN